MIEENDSETIKKKMGYLLSYLFLDAGLDSEAIDRQILENDFFDFLETGKTAEFIRRTNEEIYQNLFGIQPIFLPKEEIDSRFFWAGMSYINISIQTRTPLKRIVLQLPLNEMVSHYDPFHEMAENQLIQEFLNNENKRPILPRLSSLKKIKIKNLLLATEMSRPVLSRLFKDNQALFQLRQDRLEQIKNAFHVSPSFFKAKSSFVFYNPLFLKDQDFLTDLARNLVACFSLKKQKETFVIKDEELKNLSGQKNDESRLPVIFPYLRVSEQLIPLLEKKFATFVLFQNDGSSYISKNGESKRRIVLTSAVNDIALAKACIHYLEMQIVEAKK
jgi:hypothetical protein